MCEGRKLTGTVLKECIRQNNPNPGQFLPHNISLAVPGAAVVFNPAQELIHTQREAKSQITFEKFGHRDDQEQMEKGGSVFNSGGTASSGFWLPYLTSVQLLKFQ